MWDLVVNLQYDIWCLASTILAGELVPEEHCEPLRSRYSACVHSIPFYKRRGHRLAAPSVPSSHPRLADYITSRRSGTWVPGALAQLELLALSCQLRGSTALVTHILPVVAVHGRRVIALSSTEHTDAMNHGASGCGEYPMMGAVHMSGQLFFPLK